MILYGETTCWTLLERFLIFLKSYKVFDRVISFLPAAVSIHIYIRSFAKPDDLQNNPFERSIIEVNGIDYCESVSFKCRYDL